HAVAAHSAIDRHLLRRMFARLDRHGEIHARILHVDLVEEIVVIADIGVEIGDVEGPADLLVAGEFRPRRRHMAVAEMRAVGQRAVKHHLRKLDRPVEAVDLLVRLGAGRLQLAAGLFGDFLMREVTALFGQPVCPLPGDLPGAQKFGMRRRWRLLRFGLVPDVEIAKFRHGAYSVSVCPLAQE
ncbi:conserved hypothetical protein, partial [Ricinus communis]